MMNNFDAINHDIETSIWFSCPFFRDILLSYRIKKIIKSRDKSSTVQKWLDKGIVFDKILPVFEIINQYCSWPNNFFWPNDKLLYILRSYDSSLDGVSATMKLEASFDISLSRLYSDQNMDDVFSLISLILEGKNCTSDVNHLMKET